MMSYLILSIACLLPLAAGHSAIFHPSMWGFNVTDQTFPYDNRPVSPLMNMPFSEWWFHNHLDYPPNAGDFFELPAGQPATAEVACDKDATSYFESGSGTDIRDGNNPCPGSDISAFHTTGPDDLKGCALAITYNSDVNSVQPEDFAVFSINQTCVWNRFTDFAVPAAMPACPEGGCICAFFWIHSADSGGEQNFMNGFRCQVTGATSSTPVAQSKVPRRCGADPDNGKPQADPSNCTYGAKTPFYWFQSERNNMFEGTYSPPYYLDLYNFVDGAQNDIFEGMTLPYSNGSSSVPSSSAGSSSVNASVSTSQPVPGATQSGSDSTQSIPDASSSSSAPSSSPTSTDSDSLNPSDQQPPSSTTPAPSSSSDTQGHHSKHQSKHSGTSSCKVESTSATSRRSLKMHRKRAHAHWN